MGGGGNLRATTYLRRPAVLRRWLRSAFRRRFPASLKVSAIAAVVGAAAGGGAILFWIAVSGAQRLLFGAGPRNLYSTASNLPWWQLLLVPTLGGLAIGLVIHRFLQHRRPHGVADVIEATALRGGRLTMKNGSLAALVSAASIGCGASVGREGPIVHLGATLGAWIAKRTRISQAHVRRLIACGVAAGVAASFNAPIAGAVFAVEVVVGKYTLHTFAPIAISTVVGTSISHLYFGADPAFSIPVHAATALGDIPVYALLGIACALVTIVFLSTISATQSAFDRLHFPQRFRPAVGGFIVGLIALYTPQVLGVGYETTNAALQEALAPMLLGVLVVAKIVATGVSLGSGFGGGVFSPSLFIGAMAGGAYGAAWQTFSAENGAGYSAFTIVGMAAVVSATLGAPLSTTLIVFELTGDYPLTLAVMIAAILSSIVVNDMWGRSFFSWQLKERGVDLERSPSERLTSRVRVADLMRSDVRTIADDANREQVAEALERGKPLLVTDGEGRYRGVIDHAGLHRARDGDLAADMLERRDPLHRDDTLAGALTRIREEDHDTLPVIAGPDDDTVAGYVTSRALLNAYRGLLDSIAREERSFSD